LKHWSQWLDRFYLVFDQRLGGRLTLLVKTGLAFDQDDGAIVSRSIAFYALFSLFPLMLVLVSISSSVLVTGEARELVLNVVDEYIPSATSLIKDNIEEALQTRGTMGLIALIGLVWSASGVFSAIYRSVNRAWGNPKSQLFWSEKLFGLAVVLVVGLLLVATTLFGTIVGVFRSWRAALFGWQPFAEPGSGELWGLMSALVPALTSILAFMILYRTIPRNRIRWRDVWLGGLIAGLVWEAARHLYTWYLTNFASYNLIYGSVAAIIGFLLWAYLGAMIMLMGAEFTARYTEWRRAGRPIEGRPLSQWMNEWSKWKNPPEPLP
jgi:YihY family inner membrane protein